MALTTIPLQPVDDLAGRPHPEGSPVPARLRVTLVQGPVVSRIRAASNEATPCIGLAYVAGYARQRGYEVTILDAIAEGLNRYWPLEGRPGFICQGLPFSEIIDRIPADTDL